MRNLLTMRVKRGNQVYEVDVDMTEKKAHAAKLYVEAHDKRPTWRRVRNIKTIEILQRMIFGAECCPHCGCEIRPSL